MYCAVQSPIPGNLLKRHAVTSRGRARAGDRSLARLTACRDGPDACGAGARRSPAPQLRFRGGIANRAGAGLSRFSPGTASRSARRTGRRAARRASLRPAPRRAGPGWPARPARSRRTRPARASPGTGWRAREPGIGSKVRRDHVRPGIQVEEVLQARQDLGQSRHQRRGQLDRQRVPSRDRLDLQPTAVLSDGGRPEVSLIDDLFDAGRRPAREEAQQRRSRRAAGDRPA